MSVATVEPKNGQQTAISAPLWYRSLRSLLFRMDPEEAHTLAIKLAPLAAGLAGGPFEDDCLATSVAGIKFANPVGLAAGFDKNGRLTGCLASFGFGFAEVGSITGQSSAGNPKPRLFRLVEDEAVINRLGLNGEGADVVARRLAAANFSLPVAVNIAKTNHPSIKGEKGIADMLHSFECIKDLPLAFITLNASCPNTHEGIMQETEELDQILAGVQKLNSRNLPVLLKLSPDSTPELLETFVASACKYGIKGYVLGNTTTTRGGLSTKAESVQSMGNGGLSGRPLKAKALDLVKRVYQIKQHDQDIIGCGGIASGFDAYEFIASGARAVELYTGLIYGGPDLPLRINRELSSILKKNKQTIATAIGTAGKSA
ncbi:MAG: quinone-dependent dihydroorotate dehydrogenase [Cyanobacteria bacterium DS2.3.42]|nr:quinone-dependent dihydroorotate dehydrogenase [Cyanobacteria bacterium DS2.3.42]